MEIIKRYVGFKTFQEARKKAEELEYKNEYQQNFELLGFGFNDRDKHYFEVKE